MRLEFQAVLLFIAYVFPILWLGLVLRSVTVFPFFLIWMFTVSAVAFRDGNTMGELYLGVFGLIVFVLGFLHGGLG